jgi:hypothetical protein
LETIPHERLMAALEARIADRHLLKLLRAGVLDEGAVRRSVTGTPQGGVVTPPTQQATSSSRRSSSGEVDLAEEVAVDT